MASRGAWPFYYEYGLDRRDDPQGRDAHGIYAFKKELIYNGFANNIVVDMALFGNYVRDRTIEFQKSKSIEADGIIGPTTARYLFKKRAFAIEIQYGIPNHLLAKQKTLESSNDPVAQGYVDINDEGIEQINMHFNPGITFDQAWDPAYALDFGARNLKSAYTYCNNDWDGAVAAYNIGRYYAKLWVMEGKPASGGPDIGGVDSFIRATKYVSLVKAASY